MDCSGLQIIMYCIIDLFDNVVTNININSSFFVFCYQIDKVPASPKYQICCCLKNMKKVILYDSTIHVGLP